MSEGNYFCIVEGDMNLFETEAKAIKYAEESIEDFLDDIWDESVEQIYVGKVTRRMRNDCKPR